MGLRSLAKKGLRTFDSTLAVSTGTLDSIVAVIEWAKEDTSRLDDGIRYVKSLSFQISRARSLVSKSIDRLTLVSPDSLEEAADQLEKDYKLEKDGLTEWATETYHSLIEFAKISRMPVNAFKEDQLVESSLKNYRKAMEFPDKRSRYFTKAAYFLTAYIHGEYVKVAKEKKGRIRRTIGGAVDLVRNPMSIRDKTGYRQTDEYAEDILKMLKEIANSSDIRYKDIFLEHIKVFEKSWRKGLQKDEPMKGIEYFKIISYLSQQIQMQYKL